jgi:hypothetical protein
MKNTEMADDIIFNPDYLELQRLRKKFNVEDSEARKYKNSRNCLFVLAVANALLTIFGVATSGLTTITLLSSLVCISSIMVAKRHAKQIRKSKDEMSRISFEIIKKSSQFTNQQAQKINEQSLNLGNVDYSLGDEFFLSSKDQQTTNDTENTSDACESLENNSYEETAAESSLFETTPNDTFSNGGPTRCRKIGAKKKVHPRPRGN